MAVNTHMITRQTNLFKQIHVEASTFCNARCPLCPRNSSGYNVKGVYPEVHLSVDRFKKCLEQLQGYKFVYFNGHLGDPMMNPKIVELTEQTNCRTTITTNGSIGKEETWIKLAKGEIGVNFSIDGLEDTNHLYRQDVNWNKLMNRVKWFIDAGGRAIWKFIIFRHNMHQVDEAKALSRKLGFERFDLQNHGRNYGPAVNNEGKVTHWILPHDKLLEPTSYDVKAGIQRYKKTHANFIPEEKVYDITCEHLRDKDTYISAKGEIAPCCYHGYEMPGRPFVKLEDHYKLRATWTTKKCNPVCAMTCGS